MFLKSRINSATSILPITLPTFSIALSIVILITLSQIPKPIKKKNKRQFFFSLLNQLLKALMVESLFRLRSGIGATRNGSEQSRWANMPQELLREVLARVEASEATWPQRKSVVACGGVCRAWRHAANDVAIPPAVSSRITFPISLKQPGPREHLFQCFIKRNRNAQTYHLFLSLNNGAIVADGKFLLAARKYRRPTCTDYVISINSDDASKGSNACVGKLRSNFLGTKFTVYDDQLPHTRGANITKSRSNRLMNLKRVSPKAPTGSYPVAHISYELNVLGSRGPRRMLCAISVIPASAIEPGGVVAPAQKDSLTNNIEIFPKFPIFRSKSTSLVNFRSGLMGDKQYEMLVLKNKAPTWHEQLQCWCLNFNGRVTIASVKNFQLAASPKNELGAEEDKVILQFGKVDENLFTMDYSYPISAFQAFAICLSSFDTKIACE